MARPLLISFLIGFVTASPVGPVGLLCLRRAFSNGAKAALISALGIAVAYAGWAFASIHGLRMHSAWVERENRSLQIGIGVIFFLYGLHAVFTAPHTNRPGLQRAEKAFGFLSSFLIVGLNPATFILFSALFTLSGVMKTRPSLPDSLAIAASVFTGATLFWLMLSLVIHKGRSILPESVYTRISHLSAYTIIGFSAVILLVNMLKRW